MARRAIVGALGASLTFAAVVAPRFGRADPGPGAGAPVAIAYPDGAAEAVARARGWGYLVDKLVADGVPRGQVVRTFADPRMAAFTGLSYSLAPRESRAMYRHFLGGTSVAEARRCRLLHAAAFESAERIQGVPASVVAAILHVESGCGRNTGSAPIFYRLARLAMANEPANVAVNVARLAGGGAAYDPVVAGQARARAHYLEDTFYPEVRATFEVAARLHLDPLAMRGSPSGAFGDPQFLPTSYLRHGVDADGDGRVNLYDVSDAAASCARYLAGHGWRAGLSSAERRAVIWQYNRSDAYIDTVLTLARHLDEPAATPVLVARRPASQRQAIQRPAARRPGAQRQAAQRPAAQRQAAQRPAAQRPAAQRPGAQRQAAQRPAAQRPARHPRRTASR